ncbi:MAG: hypothetical protein HY951_09105 [Bacteroidia bacterium]|nr:hypothetical protein [Bacteroidia bacterium]
MRKNLTIFFVFIFALSSFGQQDSVLYKNRDKLCVGLNIGGLYPFYKKSIFNISNQYYDLTNYTISKNKGFFIGLNLNLQSNRRKHFIAQLDINYFYITQNLKFYSVLDTKINRDIKNGNFNFSNLGANISLIPEFIVGNKIKTFIGLGIYYSNSFNFNYKGQLETIKLKQVNDSLSPIGYYFKNDTTFYINNEISKVLKTSHNIGLVFNLGFEIPFRMNKLLIMARIYQSKNNYIEITDLRQYLVSISLTIPLNYK